jgi:hypothetical protein
MNPIKRYFKKIREKKIEGLENQKKMLTRRADQLMDQLKDQLIDDINKSR